MRKVLICSSNKIISKTIELLINENNSLKDSHKAIIMNLEDLKKLCVDKESIIILIPINKDEMYRHMWEKIRVEYKLINPILCLGTFEINKEKDFRDSIFHNSESYLEANRYRKLLNFNEINNTLINQSQLKNFESSEELDSCKSKYFKTDNLIRTFINHDLKYCDDTEKLLYAIKNLLNLDNNQERIRRLQNLENNTTLVKTDISSIYKEYPLEN
ncbi:MAG: hypothetical protein U0354_14185 [Candidatus Sericytochromatia bacterium]